VIDPPSAYDAGFEDLVKRSEALEQEVMQGAGSRGLTVVEIPPSRGNVADGAAVTAPVLSSGGRGLADPRRDSLRSR
jgi:hypothetical protein